MYGGCMICGLEKSVECQLDGKPADDCPVEAINKAMADLAQAVKGTPAVAALRKFMGLEEDKHE